MTKSAVMSLSQRSLNHGIRDSAYLSQLATRLCVSSIYTRMNLTLVIANALLKQGLFN